MVKKKLRYCIICNKDITLRLKHSKYCVSCAEKERINGAIKCRERYINKIKKNKKAKK